MTGYTAPLSDMRFVLKDLVNFDTEIATLPGYEEATPDLVDAVLEEAGKVASDVLAPLNRVGDEQGSILENGVVRTPDGFRDAYHQFVEGGWTGLPFNPEYGGQGLPYTLNMAITEMWDAANTSFSLCPMLTQGAIEALESHGTEELKRLYLEKLISGEWSGTMNLTEPQAGSDVGALRTKAVPEGDHYLISGTKIFITFGDQDYTDNIVHLVLARLPDAPPGTKGISLFLVPKFLVNPDGSLGARNDVKCTSLEHKLGIHASPTCVLSYGDDGGAIGYLVGEGERRHGLYVHHDEQRPHQRRTARSGHRRPRLAAGPRVRQGTGAEPRHRRQPRSGDDHPSPRCAAHAHDHEGADRGDAGAVVFRRRRNGQVPAAA